MGTECCLGILPPAFRPDFPAKDPGLQPSLPSLHLMLLYVQCLDPDRSFLCCPPWLDALCRPRLPLQGPSQAPFFLCTVSVSYGMSTAETWLRGNGSRWWRRACCIYSKRYLQHAVLEGSRVHQQQMLVQQSLSRRGCRLSCTQCRCNQSPPLSPAFVSGQFAQTLGCSAAVVKMNPRTLTCGVLS